MQGDRGAATAAVRGVRHKHSKDLYKRTRNACFARGPGRSQTLGRGADPATMQKGSMGTWAPFPLQNSTLTLLRFLPSWAPWEAALCEKQKEMRKGVSASQDTEPDSGKNPGKTQISFPPNIYLVCVNILSAHHIHTVCKGSDPLELALQGWL